MFLDKYTFPVAEKLTNGAIITQTLFSHGFVFKFGSTLRVIEAIVIFHGVKWSWKGVIQQITNHEHNFRHILFDEMISRGMLLR